MQFGRIGNDPDPWLTRRLWLHAAVVAPLIATAVAGAAIAIYVGFGGESKADKDVPLSGVGVLAGAVYAAVIARRMNGAAGWPLRAAVVAAIVVVLAWLISLTVVVAVSV